MENNFVNLKNMFYTKAQFIIVLTCSSKFFSKDSFCEYRRDAKGSWQKDNHGGLI